MDDTTVVHILAGAMVMTLKLAGPILAVCLIVGLVLVLGGPWMIHQFTGYVQELWRMIPSM